MKCAILIQARTNSRRFPQKIFSNLPAPLKQYKSAPMLLHLYERARNVDKELDVHLLIPKEDTKLIEWCNKHNLSFFAGSLENVRERYVQAAQKYKLDAIIRLTGDNPCFDSEIAKQSIRHLIEQKLDLFSYINLPIGVGVEAFTLDALECPSIYKEKIQNFQHPLYCEHVSLHIKHYPEFFKILHLEYPHHKKSLLDPAIFKQLRLTLDTQEDLDVIRDVYECLGSQFSLKDILQLAKKKPEIFLRNAKIIQQKFSKKDISHMTASKKK